MSSSRRFQVLAGVLVLAPKMARLLRRNNGQIGIIAMLLAHISVILRMRNDAHA
jgi:hypothetical protein